NHAYNLLITSSENAFGSFNTSWGLYEKSFVIYSNVPSSTEFLISLYSSNVILRYLKISPCLGNVILSLKSLFLCSFSKIGAAAVSNNWYPPAPSTGYITANAPPNPNALSGVYVRGRTYFGTSICCS